jgi:hypothetical protein
VRGTDGAKELGVLEGRVRMHALGRRCEMMPR